MNRVFLYTPRVCGLVKHKKSKGFTLAEVLITLVVIGVIAAITIPTMQANYRRQEASARLKKFYSTINQAAIKSKADGYDWEEWAQNNTNASDHSGVSTNNFFDQYLKNYIVYSKKQGKTVYLNDGSKFSMMKSNCMEFLYDVNGDKKPNKDARDIFHFVYCPVSYDNYKGKGAGGVSPILPKYMNKRSDMHRSCKNVSFYCSGLLHMDSWEFKLDYPHKI